MTREKHRSLSVLLFACLAWTWPGQAGAQEAGAFQFRAGPERTAVVTLSAAEGASTFTMPAAGWHTALMAVRLSADASASPAPFLEIRSGDLADRQYFAAADIGVAREVWVNLSFLRGSAAGTKVELRGEGIALASPDAAIRMFVAAPDLTKSLLVLAPHPDDAEIAAFGLYAYRRSAVVTITAGNAGAPTYEAVFDDPSDLYLFKGRIRLIDSITIPWQGGIPPERAFNMGYFDARLAEMYDKRNAVIPEMYRANSDVNVYRRENIGSLLPKRSRESTWANLVDDVLTVLRRTKPAIIVAPHPQLDSHRDHQFTSVALAQALERWKRPVTLLLYTNHADQNRYPYGPAGTLMSLPPVPAGRTVSVDGVYSHPLPTSLQRLKLFALESMHDLRFTPTRQYQLAREDARALSPEKVGPDPDITYLRRGPRSNELFYLYDRTSFAEMIAQFLKDRPSGPAISKQD